MHGLRIDARSAVIKMFFVYNILFFLLIASCSGQNIVLFLTDDQDSVLGGMEPMKNVKKLIADVGVTFTNSYTVSPVCCPSRASILSGMYPHNHLTHNNSLNGGCFGGHWKNVERETFATTLKEAGYKTFYAGKYLNQYGKDEAGGPTVVPPGWSEWHGLVGNSVFYNYVLSNNGVPTHSSDLYLTDVIGDISVSFIENLEYKEPFLMVLAPPAPHAPFTPAPRHEGKYANVTAMKNPSFNIKSDDKHWLMRMPPTPLPDSLLPELDRVYRSRWETLLAVDEMVADVVNALENKDLLKDTYLIYTSDNGYHIGQFSQVYDKRQPYETDVKVPLIISGPNIKQNIKNDNTVLNIDLAPTILELTGKDPLKNMDGKKIELFDSKDEIERDFLVEYNGEGNENRVDDRCRWKYDGKNLSECYPEYDCKCQDSRNNTYTCLKHLAPNVNMKYCLFNDHEQFIEAYDLITDPHELYNIANEIMPARKVWYTSLIHKLLNCKGSQCYNM